MRGGKLDACNSSTHMLTCLGAAGVPPQTVDRLKMMLAGFTNAPWTLQRLCEVLLEPRKQYSKLHKVCIGQQQKQALKYLDQQMRFAVGPGRACPWFK